MRFRNTGQSRCLGRGDEGELYWFEPSKPDVDIHHESNKSVRREDTRANQTWNRVERDVHSFHISSRTPDRWTRYIDMPISHRFSSLYNTINQ